MLKRPYILIGLLTLIILAGLLLSQKHPMLMKILIGQAQSVGRPISANVFTDGKLNNTIKVYEYDDCILLYREGFKGTKEIVCADLKTKFVGTPISSGEKDYKIYKDHLIQSEAGGIFVRFNDGAKRAKSFNPDLKVEKQEISFKMSPEAGDFNCDSTRVVKINSN